MVETGNDCEFEEVFAWLSMADVQEKLPSQASKMCLLSSVMFCTSSHTLEQSSVNISACYIAKATRTINTISIVHALSYCGHQN